MRRRRHLSRRSLMSAIAAAVASPAVAHASRQSRDGDHFEVVELDLVVAGLDDAHDGVRIGQLSDIHIGRGVPDSRVIAAVHTMNALDPDLVMLTGDFVTTARDPYDHVPVLLEGLAAPAYAVLGNHDHWSDPKEVRTNLERIGITVLQNEHTVVPLKGAPFTILGVDDSTTHHDDVAKAFKGATTGSRLVLAHTPTSIDTLPSYEGLLQLSGHTHGGQLNLGAFTNGLFKLAHQPYLRGLFHIGGNQLYVNRGLGFGKGTRLPRVNSDPELTVLTLRAVS